MSYFKDFFGGLVGIMMAILPVAILWQVLTGGIVFGMDVIKNGDAMDLWGRYNLSFAWLTMQAPTDSTMMDNMNIGIGYSLKVWNEMYIEPSYTMPMKADSEGNREGKMKLGLSYRF